MAGGGGRRREALLPDASFGGHAPASTQPSHVHSVASELFVAELPAGGVSAIPHAANEGSAPPPGGVEAPAPVPAYTSLARQQLHARLKAAISAGRRAAPSGEASGSLGKQQPKRGPGWVCSASAPAGARSPTSPALQLPSEPATAPRPGSDCTQLGLAGTHAPGPRVLHRTASGQCELDAAAGFQLPTLSAGRPGRGQRRRQGPQGPCPAELGPAASATTPAAPGGATAPHWLAAQLLHTPLYHAPAAEAGAHGGSAAGRAQRRGGTQPRGVHRGLLALRMPPLTGPFAESMPVRAVDADSQPCLLVLPSDSPSSRAEAASATRVLLSLLADPAAAAARAAAWRRQLLLGSSSASLLGLTAGFDAPPAPGQQAGGSPRLAGSPGGGGGGTLAGPAWLAGSPAAGGAGCDWVQAVRDTSPSLHTGGRVGQAWERPQAASPTGIRLPPPAPRPPLPSPVSAPGGGSGDPAWDSFCFASLAAGLAACMAEAVRQVEVGCAERGRLLALLWNGYTGVLAATLQQQQQQVLALAADNANLSAEAGLLRWEASSAEFLRREIMRLRNDQETSALALQDSRQEAATLHEQLAAAGEQQDLLAAHLRRRRAVLRWRCAAAAALLPPAMRVDGAQRLSLGPDAAAAPLPQQLAGVEAAAAAAVALQQLRRHWKERGRAEAAVAAALGAAGGAHGAARPLLSSTSRPPSRLRPSASGAAAAAGAAHAGEQLSLGGSAAALLHQLRPEARALVLVGLPPPQRQALLAAMGDGERAALAVQLEEPARLQLYADMGPALAAATDAAILRKPLLLARLLAGQAPEAARATFAAAARPQRVALAAAAPPPLAAGLVLGLAAAEQLDVLLEMPASCAAAVLQCVAPAAGLQLLLAAAELDGRPQEPQPPQQQPQQQGAASGGPSFSKAADVLAALPERHLSAMLAAALPAEVAALLPLAPPAQRAAVLRLVPAASTRSAALAMAHQHRAAAARAAAEASPEAAGEVAAAGGAACLGGAGAGGNAPGDAAAAAGVEDPPGGADGWGGDLGGDHHPQPGLHAAAAAEEEGAGALPPLDAASALHAHFQLLSAAEKTHLLLMGPAATAALLLPLLEEGEVAEVLPLLPQERQHQLLRTLSPAAEARLRAAARLAARRRSSLKLPQLGPAAAAAAAVERRSSLQAPSQQQQQRQQGGSGMLRRASSQRQRAPSPAPTPPRRASACSPGGRQPDQAAGPDGR